MKPSHRIEEMKEVIQRWKQRAEAAEAQLAEMRNALKDIDIIAHHGGLANLDESQAINLVRRVTMPYVSSSITEDEVLRRIQECKYGKR